MPAANGTTTAMMAVAAHNAAMTEACASSTGCSDPTRRAWLARRVAVISRFCQSPHTEPGAELCGPLRPQGLIRIVKLCNHGGVNRTLGADLLAVVARLNRLASQRARIPLPFAQG